MYILSLFSLLQEGRIFFLHMRLLEQVGSVRHTQFSVRSAINSNNLLYGKTFVNDRKTTAITKSTMNYRRIWTRRKEN